MRERLAHERRLKGYTQAHIAEIFRISIRHYQRIESGHSYGSGQVRDRLVQFFGIPAEELLAVSDEEPKPAA